MNKIYIAPPTLSVDKFLYLNLTELFYRSAFASSDCVMCEGGKGTRVNRLLGSDVKQMMLQ